MLAMLLCLCAVLPTHAEVTVPDLNRRVTDLTGTLTPDTVNRLESTLAQFEAAKGSQIAVLMLPTTEPEDIAEYGIRVADQWKVGRKGVDDGVILIVAKDDRRVRIEVGYGLEGVIPDVIAKRIIEEDIVPHFKQGDFSGGVEAGVTRMMRLIEGEPLPSPSSHRAQDGFSTFMDKGFFFIIAGIFAGSLLRIFLGRGTGSVMGALGAGGLAWLFSGLFFMGFVVAIIVLLGVFGNGRGGGHWGGGGFGGGSFGGGGGFSGGGGGFGGGGSSGSW